MRHDGAASGDLESKSPVERDRPAILLENDQAQFREAPPLRRRRGERHQPVAIPPPRRSGATATELIW